jgi:hypothetical protein
MRLGAVVAGGVVTAADMNARPAGRRMPSAAAPTPPSPQAVTPDELSIFGSRIGIGTFGTEPLSRFRRERAHVVVLLDDPSIREVGGKELFGQTFVCLS